jgi:hypothetical protein
VRFAPDQPTCVDKNEELVNFLEIDGYMINQAELMQETKEAKDIKVKTLGECLSFLETQQQCQVSLPMSSRTESHDVDLSCYNPHHPHH